MGNLEAVNRLFEKVVYLDANIFIYAVEQPSNVGQYAQFINGLFGAIDEGKIKAITSELTLSETLVGAYTKFPKLIEIYEELIKESAFLQVCAVDRDVLKQAALLRSLSKIALADAIHVATAIRNNANVMITNDKKMQVPHEIEKLILSESIL